ncbi:MAG: hypothetical protein AB7P40_28185 [Chloroflexota bacterium]
MIQAAGFRPIHWEDVTATTSLAPVPAPGTPPGLQSLVLGDAFPAVRAVGMRNFDEGRIVNIYGVCERP